MGNKMDNIGRELKKTQVLVMRYFNSLKCENDEHTEMNRRVMVYMYEHRNEDIYQKDIETNFSLCRSSASGLIDRMIDKGLIEALKVSDKRRKKLVLTKKANDSIEKITKQVEQFEKNLSKGILEEDLQVFFKVLNAINDNIYKLIEKGEGDAHS